jgi:hypothetical protein
MHFKVQRREEFPNTDDTLHGADMKPDIAEPNINQVPNCVSGSKLRVGKVNEDTGIYLSSP